MKLLADERFWVEVRRHPAGDLLAREPLDGLDRLAAEARYEAGGRGLLPDEPDRLSARFVPVVRRSDRASLAGVRVEVAHESGPAAKFAWDYPAEVASPRGLELASELVAGGTLVEGDRYAVLLSAEPANGHGDGRDGGGGVTETPFPVRAGGLGAFGIGPEAVADACAERPVFVARSVLGEAADDAVRHGRREVGTLLLGVLVCDPALLEAGCATSWAVVVTSHVPVEGGRGTASSFVFPPESFRQARRAAARRGQGEAVVGSQHSHGWTCPRRAGRRAASNLFFSSDDERMTHHFPVYAPFLVVGADPERSRDRPVANLYVRLRGTIHNIPYGTF